LLGYLNAALADAEDGLKKPRELGQAAILMWALFYGLLPRVWCGKYAGARLQADELVVLANEKGTPFWKANGIREGYLLAEAGGAVDEIGEYENAERCIREAMTAVESTGERWYEAEVNRMQAKSRSTRPTARHRTQNGISSVPLL
jgi:hypothetical protein